MNVRYPLFAFGKDDSSIRLIENERDILGKLEAIDIENDEYVLWDAKGAGVAIEVSVGPFKSKLVSVLLCEPAISIADAFRMHANANEISEFTTEGTPSEIWERLRAKSKIR
jgi:hypothetical protein